MEVSVSVLCAFTYTAMCHLTMETYSENCAIGHADTPAGIHQSLDLISNTIKMDMVNTRGMRVLPEQGNYCIVNTF